MSDSMNVKHICAIIALAECSDREKPYQTNGKGFFFKENTLRFVAFRATETDKNNLESFNRK